MARWRPDEIIVHRKVKDDTVSKRVVEQCPGVPVRYVSSAKPNEVIAASEVLSKAGKGMIDSILAGKKVLLVAPPGPDTVDVFTMPDERMVCPHFYRLKLASNGCFYRCDWCYLKLTYRAAYPFITVRTGFRFAIDEIRKYNSDCRIALCKESASAMGAVRTQAFPV